MALAFVGFHPYTKESLVITLVDPPRGSAVGKSVRALRQAIPRLRINVVNTRGDSSHLEELEETVQHLGRFNSIGDWLAIAPVHSHLLFHFVPRPPGTAAVAREGWGPTPGAHMALQIRLAAPLPFAEQLSPYVTFEPRRDNGPVIAIQRLAAGSPGAPKLFQLRPVLSEEETADFTRASAYADWSAICAPSPLGLVAPRALGGGLTYLGRENLGTFGLFVYATDLFPLRKFVTRALRPAPLQPDREEVERRLTELAVQSGSGVLRIGKSASGTQGSRTLWEQVGVIVSSALAERVA